MQWHNYVCGTYFKRQTYYTPLRQIIHYKISILNTRLSSIEIALIAIRIDHVQHVYIINTWGKILLYLTQS